MNPLVRLSNPAGACGGVCVKAGGSMNAQNATATPRTLSRLILSLLPFRDETHISCVLVEVAPWISAMSWSWALAEDPNQDTTAQRASLAFSHRIRWDYLVGREPTPLRETLSTEK